MAPDPTGHGFFSFLGSIFKAIFSSIRTIASIAVAAVIAIYAPQFLSTYFGITAGTFGSIVVTGAITGFASGLVATGSITGALKGAFWGAIGAAAAFGVAELTANAFNISSLKAHAATLWKAGMQKIAVYKSMLHGLTRGIISKLQGGRFLSGFMSGVSSMFDVGAQGHGGFVGRTAIMAIVGGTFSMLGGGKFASGALAGAFVHMFNREVAEYFKKVEALAQKYKQEYERATSRLVDKSLGKASGFVAGSKAVFDLNKKYIGYPAGFAKKVYTGSAGAMWKIMKGGRYPMTILSRGAGGAVAGVVGSLAFDLGKEATFYFKAYREAW